jgi:hypothetical protein
MGLKPRRNTKVVEFRVLIYSSFTPQYVFTSRCLATCYLALFYPIPFYCTLSPFHSEGH